MPKQKFAGQVIIILFTTKKFLISLDIFTLTSTNTIIS